MNKKIKIPKAMKKKMKFKKNRENKKKFIALRKNFNGTIPNLFLHTDCRILQIYIL